MNKIPDKDKKIGKWTISLVPLSNYGGMVSAKRFLPHEKFHIHITWTYKYGPNAEKLYNEIKDLKSIGKVVRTHKSEAMVR